MSARRLRAAAVVAVLALASGATACSGDSRAERDERPGPAAEGCGPPAYDEVRGRPPSYVDPPLDRVPNDHALCRALWLPRVVRDFVPQGLVVEDGAAWVSGYDKGRTPYGTDTCRIMRIDLRTGRLLQKRAPVAADLAPRGPAVCRHAGGLALTEHGLWVSQRTKIWLLDPADLAVLSVWHLVEPVRGSFLAVDDRGRIGAGGFHEKRRWPVHWFDPGTILAPGVIDLTADNAVGSQIVPRAGQGAVWADLGPGGGRLWVTRSNTYCGELWSGPRLRFAFLPGAEGVDLDGDRLWVVSETPAAPYFLQGGRPTVPALAAYDVSDLAGWQRSACGA